MGHPHAETTSPYSENRTTVIGKRAGGYDARMDAQGTLVTEIAPADEHVDAGFERELVEDEVLVEEISIDGMCGVY
jgi:mycofactocin precursor